MSLKGKKILVFCSSSRMGAGPFRESARQTGLAIARAGGDLVFGGSDTGMMGIVARAVKEAGGRVTGVIPRLIYEKGIAYAGCDHLILCEDLGRRKRQMEELCDGILCLPGGIGSLDELTEILALKQLGAMPKPLVLLNQNGFYDGLLAFMEDMIRAGFATPRLPVFMRVVSTPGEAVNFFLANEQTAEG